MKTQEQPKVDKPSTEKFVFTVGKRKRAIARATTKPGTGKVIVNSKSLDMFQDDYIRLRIQEPLLLAGDSAKKFDIDVLVRGGGPMGQADAVRQAISKGLIAYVPELKQPFVQYDRNLLVYDPRRTEPHKPPHSSWGPRRYKQRSKR